MKTKPLFFSMVLLACLCATVCKVQAQKPGSNNTSKPGNGNGPGGGNNGNGNGNGGSQAPIDGGLSLLLAAGIGAGAKKAYDKRKAKGREAIAG